MDAKYLKKKRLPDVPGVYFFMDRNKKPIYIGKATSLKDRVRSYFSSDLVKTRGALLVKMLISAKSIEWKPTKSVLEALLLEADLIKKFHPVYNTKEKDDKSFNCVVITKEDFPRILIIRKKDTRLPSPAAGLGNGGQVDFSKLRTLNLELRTIFGPFPNGGQLKEAMKIIRKIFPYSDGKCFPKGSPRNKNGKPCFSRQIGLCPGVCTGEISKQEYKKTINNIKLFFEGKTKTLLRNLQKDMKKYAQEKDFENASAVRDTIYAINHIHDISLIKSDPISTLNSQLSTLKIEAYDIAHLSGKNMVGVCVSVVDGVPEKSNYKKFNIKTIFQSNDTGALKEILSRRFNHTEWKFPNLVVIDGGIQQLNATKEVFAEKNISIPVVSVVKDDKHKAREILGDENFAKLHKNAIILANGEAHRFAIAFHRKKRKSDFLP